MLLPPKGATAFALPPPNGFPDPDAPPKGALLLLVVAAAPKGLAAETVLVLPPKGLVVTALPTPAPDAPPNGPPAELPPNGLDVAVFVLPKGLLVAAGFVGKAEVAAEVGAPNTPVPVEAVVAAGVPKGLLVVAAGAAPKVEGLAAVLLEKADCPKIPPAGVVLAVDPKIPPPAAGAGVGAVALDDAPNIGLALAPAVVVEKMGAADADADADTAEAALVVLAANGPGLVAGVVDAAVEAPNIPVPSAGAAPKANGAGALEAVLTALTGGFEAAPKRSLLLPKGVETVDVAGVPVVGGAREPKVNVEDADDAGAAGAETLEAPKTGVGAELALAGVGKAGDAEDVAPNEKPVEGVVDVVAGAADVVVVVPNVGAVEAVDGAAPKVNDGVAVDEGTVVVEGAVLLAPKVKVGVVDKVVGAVVAEIPSEADTLVVAPAAAVAEED